MDLINKITQSREVNAVKATYKNGLTFIKGESSIEEKQLKKITAMVKMAKDRLSIRQDFS